MPMFKTKYESCMILGSKYFKGYAILLSKKILLQGMYNLSQSSYTVERQICVSRGKFINPPQR